MAVHLLQASDSLRSAVAASCDRYLRAEAALVAARFGEPMGRTAQTRARTLGRFRMLDDSVAAIERRLLAELDSIAVENAWRSVDTDSTGRFSFRGVPPGRYALTAAATEDGFTYRWWSEIAPNRRGRLRLELARPAAGHLTCFDPGRTLAGD